MFPKKNRITKREFDELMKNGRVFHSPLFSLRFGNKKNDDIPKFAFVISKKVAKNASDRNILKRRGFHALRELIFPLSVEKRSGHMVAFFFKKEAIGLKFKDIKKDMEILLKKNGVL